MKTQKHGKLYDLVARKVIISRDIQFVENESWDETIEKNVNIVSNVEHEDMMEEVVQTPQVNQPVIAPSTPMILRHGSVQGTSTQIQLKLHREAHQEDNRLH